MSSCSRPSGGLGETDFHHDRRPALTKVNGFLKTVGVLCVGRFAEWKYHMTHDCALSAKRVAEQLCRVAAVGRVLRYPASSR